MGNVTWTAFTKSTDLAGTALDAVGSGAISGPLTAFDNSANLAEYGCIELLVGSLTPSGSPPYVSLFVVPNPSSGYIDAPLTGGQYTDTWLQNLKMNTNTGQKRLASRIFRLPPFKLEIYVDNYSGVTFPGSGNSLFLYYGGKTVA